MAAPKIVQSTTRMRSGFAMAGSAAAAGMIASLALSSLILLVERVAGFPVGTFYLVLVSAITQVTDYGMSAIAQGLLLHLAAGTLIGLVLAVPFAASRKAYSILGRSAPALGLGAGMLIWAALFLPVTFGVILPLLQSLDNGSVISQRLPVGNLFQVAVGDLVEMIDRVIYAALAFNMFYGLIAFILIRSFAERLVDKSR